MTTMPDVITAPQAERHNRRRKGYPLHDALVRSASAIHSTADQGSVVSLVSL